MILYCKHAAHLMGFLPRGIFKLNLNVFSILGNSEQGTGLYLHDIRQLGNHELEYIFHFYSFTMTEFYKDLLNNPLFQEIEFLKLKNTFFCQYVTDPSGHQFRACYFKGFKLSVYFSVINLNGPLDIRFIFKKSWDIERYCYE